MQVVVSVLTVGERDLELRLAHVPITTKGLSESWRGRVAERLYAPGSTFSMTNRPATSARVVRPSASSFASAGESCTLAPGTIRCRGRKTTPEMLRA